MPETCECCLSGTLQQIPELILFDECDNCGAFHNRRRREFVKPCDFACWGEWELVRNDVEKYLPILEEIESLIPGRERFYDAGCFMGHSLWLAKMRGWKEVAGCDINKGAVDAARRMFGIGLVSWSPFLMAVAVDADCVMFHHGIEHMYRPLDNLLKAAKMVSKRQGIIYLAHPTISSRELIADQADSGHSYEWTTKAFQMMVSKSHLNIVKSVCSERSQNWILRP